MVDSLEFESGDSLDPTLASSGAFADQPTAQVPTDRRVRLAEERAARRERHRIASALAGCLALGVSAAVIVVNLAR